MFRLVGHQTHTITDDSGECSDSDSPTEPPDPADIADADAFEELGDDPSVTSTQPMPDNTPLDTTPNPEQSELGDPADADIVVSESEPAVTVDIQQFPFGMPGAPIPGRAQDPSEYETQAANQASPWAPFCSQLEWDVARWVKLRGGSSTAVSELLAIPGVRASTSLNMASLT
jgi:hypothetical protein